MSDEEDKDSEVEDSVEELIDLIRDIKSPWYEAYDWSKNCDSIRERFIKDKKSINLNNIEQYFTNLRLNDKNVIFKLKKYYNNNKIIFILD